MAEVLVEQHEAINAQDILMRLDTHLEEIQLDIALKQRAALSDENDLITGILSGAITAKTIGRFDQDAPFLLQLRRMQAQESFQAEQTRLVLSQMDTIRRKLSHLDRQRGISRNRAETQRALADRGIVTQISQERLEDQALFLEREFEDARIELLTQEDALLSARQAIDIEKLTLRETLAASFERNERALVDLEQRIADLEDRIAAADIHAPVGGSITQVHFPAAGMYATRGATLISLAQELDAPRAAFYVPVGFVDQLAVGMRGNLTIPALPQRIAPKVDVVIQAISPRAELDENGNPTGYAGVAEIDLQGLGRLFDAFDSLELAEDMPVDITVAVRQTTLAEYLITPFFENFRNALQD